MDINLKIVTVLNTSIQSYQNLGNDLVTNDNSNARIEKLLQVIRSTHGLAKYNFNLYNSRDIAIKTVQC